MSRLHTPRFDRSDDPRRLLRHVVKIAAVLSASTLPGRLLGMVRNISPSGCQVESVVLLAAGRFVIVTLPSFEPRGGRIIWEKDGSFGFQFERPLHRAVVEHLAKRQAAAE